MICWIFIIILALGTVFLAYLMLMPVKIKWNRQYNEKSIWTIYTPIIETNSQEKRILWIRKDKTQKKSSRKETEPKPGKKISNGETDKMDTKTEEMEKEILSKKKKGKKFDWDNLKQICEYRETLKKVIYALIVFLKRIALSFKWDETNRVEVELALKNPYHLGITCAYIYSVLYSFPSPNWIHFSPDFESQEDSVEMFGKISLNTRFGKILFAIAILFWKLPKFRLYKLWRKSKKIANEN